MDNKRQESAEVEIENAEEMPKSQRKKLPANETSESWKKRVCRKKYKNPKTGKVEEVGTYSITLSHKKRRVYFNLGSKIHAAAIRKAKAIRIFLKVNGWDATLAKYKPQIEEEPEICNIGDLIRAAAQKAEIRPRTMQGYKNSIRRLASDIKGIDASDKSKYRPGGGDWQGKVDAVKLSMITSDNVKSWRVKQLKGLDSDPVKKRRKEISVDTVINHSRSIWKYSGFPSPFDGLKWKQTTAQFKPKIAAEHLLYLAEEELNNKKNKEQYKALALCLFLGLRKREADCLSWEQIDLSENRVSIKRTSHFQPKSAKSERDIPLNESLLKEINKWRKAADKTFVLSGKKAKPDASYPYYRAEKTWKDLTVWLRSKGIESAKPIHDLRKLSISLVYAASDIYGAQMFAGHADVRTTIGSYLHKKAQAPIIVPKMPEPKAVRS